MVIDDRVALSAALRRNFDLFLRMAYRELGGEGEYSHNWHIDAIAHQLDRIRTGENRRLIVTMPPRHLKSVTISIAWVAFMLGHNPALKFLCISYGQELADDHARGCLKIMQSRWYRQAFPSVVLHRRAVSDFTTTAGGGRISTSVDGITTGFGADIIVIDDPMKAQDTTSEAARTKIERWFDETAMQRLNDQETGSFVVVMQRLHEADLAGVLKARGTWHELRLPAIADRDEAIPIDSGRCYHRREGHALHPARQSIEMLHERRAANAFVFASQYQQDPVPLHGNIIEAAWLGRYDPATLDTTMGIVVQSWDTASKDNPFNDYSVCVTARVIGQSIYIVDVVRKRMKFPDLISMTIALAKLHGTDALLIEDASSGQQLIQTLQALGTPGVPSPIARKPEGDKIARVQGVSAMIESGRVYLPTSAHWLASFMSELLGFPSSRYDDQVDALAQLLGWLRQRDTRPKISTEGPIIMYEEHEEGPEPTQSSSGILVDADDVRDNYGFNDCDSDPW